ncbi:O-antigen ligase family protein [Candidatus Parcubacteria bacterium]|nr:O-antigen ligase family protein [Candidatus Parcubacteria bacterium]
MISIFGVCIIIYSIFYLILAKYNLKLAVSLIIFALPSYLIRFKIFGIPFTLLEIMILISFAVWFSRNYKSIFQNIKYKIKAKKLQVTSHKLINYPFSVEIALLLVISYISVAFAGFSNEALGVWKAYFFEPLLFYILVLNVFNNNANSANYMRIPRIDKNANDDNFKFIMYPLILSAFVVSLFAIYQKFTGNFIANEFWANNATRRVTSFFSYPNAVGLYLAPVVVLMVGYIFLLQIKCCNLSLVALKNKIATSYSLLAMTGVTIILSFFAIYFARSEGALVAVIIALFLFGLFINKEVRCIVLLLAIMLGVGISAPQTIRQKVVQKVFLNDLSGEIRKQQWRETWRMMTDSPVRFIFGTGLSGYQKNVLPYHQEGIFFNKDNDPDFRRKIVIYNDKYRAEHWQPVEVYMYPHNIFLNFWTELGLVGVILFIWIIGKFYYIIYKNIQNSKFKIQNLQNNSNRLFLLGLAGSMTVIIIHGLVDVPYFKNDLAIMFWLIIAILGIFKLNSKILLESNKK